MWIETGLESGHLISEFSETSAVIHGRSSVATSASNMTEPLDDELLKDLRGLGKPPSFRVSRLSLQLSNPHEPRQHSLSTVDGQVRSRTKSDLPGSRASAGRCTFEVLYTDVLLVGFDHEWQEPQGRQRQTIGRCGNESAS